MANPWLSIPLADYEGHMNAPQVHQLEALSDLFAEALTQRRPESVALLGIAGGNCAAFFLKVPPAIPLDWAGIGLLICSLVGIIFGTYPAFKAANLDPIESLRYE